MSQPLPPLQPPWPGGPRVDPTGLRYDRADTEPAAAPVPDGIELVHFGRDIPELTPADLGAGDDLVSQILHLVSQATPAELRLVRRYLRPAPAPAER